MARRFIAGAVCPECQAVDRLIVETVAIETVDGESIDGGTTDLPGSQRKRICVACGFTDSHGTSGTGSIPRGRPEQRRSVQAKAQTNRQTKTQTVKFIEVKTKSETPSSSEENAKKRRDQEGESSDRND